MLIRSYYLTRQKNTALLLLTESKIEKCYGKTKQAKVLNAVQEEDKCSLVSLNVTSLVAAWIAS